MFNMLSLSAALPGPFSHCSKGHINYSPGRNVRNVIVYISPPTPKKAFSFASQGPLRQSTVETVMAQIEEAEQNQNKSVFKRALISGRLFSRHLSRINGFLRLCVGRAFATRQHY